MGAVVKLLLMSILSWLTAVPSLSAECATRRPVTEFGRRFSIAAEADADRLSVFVPQNPAANTKHMRVRIEVAEAADCDWLLTVRDKGFHLIQTLVASDFDGSTSRWTARAETDQTIFELRPCRDGRAPTIRVNEYLVMLKENTNPYYSTQTDRPAWEPLYQAQSGLRQLGDAVGMFTSMWEQTMWVCSGVFVAPTLFLTNWHCGGPGEDRLNAKQYWNPIIRQSALIDASWDDDRVAREFVVSAMEASDPGLDFAVLRVKPIHSDGPVRAARLARTTVPENIDLRLVHHPLGEQKRLSIEHCRIISNTVDGRPGDFLHQCDSEGGSSGAPLFNDRSEVVGLHHLGFKFADDCKTSDKLNKAIRVQAILDALGIDKYKVLMAEINAVR